MITITEEQAWKFFQLLQDKYGLKEGEDYTKKLWSYSTHISK